MYFKCGIRSNSKCGFKCDFKNYFIITFKIQTVYVNVYVIRMYYKMELNYVIGMYAKIKSYYVIKLHFKITLINNLVYVFIYVIVCVNKIHL